jgi:hypothetical protein
MMRGMRVWGRISRGALLGLAFGAALVALGCDSGEHPDTGFGGDAAVPATINCADLCQRSATCVVDLCDEDSSSMKFAGIGQPVDEECLASCTDPQLQAAASQASWDCLFKSTCRQAFGENVCNANAHYSCSSAL